MIRHLTLFAGMLLALTTFAAPLGAAPDRQPAGTSATQASEQPLNLSPTTLPTTQVATDYAEALVASGGVAPYSFTISEGSLPPGFSLSAEGVISGRTGSAGTFTFVVTLTDATGAGLSRYFYLSVLTPIAVSPPSLAEGKVGMAYSQQFAASGGSAPYTFAVTEGSLPPGLSLSPSGRLSGIPTAASTYHLKITATDAQALQATSEYWLYIASAITVSPNIVPPGKVGAVYSQQMSASGGAAPYTFTVAGSLPSGLALSTSGLLAGTPTAAGYYAFNIVVTDTQGYAGIRSYYMTVAEPFLTLSPAYLPDSKIGVQYRQRFTASGGTAPYSFALVGGELPPGMSFGADGTLSGRPTAEGGYYLEIAANDVRGITGRQAYSFVVTRAYLAIGPSTLPSADTGALYRQRLTASGGTAPYRFSITSGALPPGLSLSSDGWLRGRAKNGGSYNFTVLVADGRGNSGMAWYNLIVRQTLEILPEALLNGMAGTPYSQQLVAAGGASPYTFALAEGGLPPGLALSRAGLLSGTPTRPGYYGIVVTATDAGGVQATRYYWMQVATSIAFSPTALLDGRVGRAYFQRLAASGGVAPYSYSVWNGSLQSGLSLSPEGVLSGTPAEDGDRYFDIVATDSRGVVASQSYRLVVEQALLVTPPYLPPATFNEPYSLQLSASGGTAPYRFSISEGSLPPGFTLSQAGLLAGSPTSPYGEQFTVTATDAKGLTGRVSFSIPINVPQITVGPDTIPETRVGSPYQVQLTASGGTGPYIFSSNGMPPGLRLKPNGLLEGTPTSSGWWYVRVEALDVNGIWGTTEYELVIRPISINPPSLPNPIVGQAYDQQLSVEGGTAPYVFLPRSWWPAGLTLSRTGRITGTVPYERFFGFEVLVIDANGYTSQQSYWLYARQPLTLSAASLPEGTVSAAYSAGLSVGGGAEPYSFEVVEGALPPGLELDAYATISGTPTVAGVYPFVVRVSDSEGQTAQQSYTIVVN